MKGLLHEAGAIGKGPITGREQEIIDSVCQRLSNKEIAERLGLSPHTVKVHLNRIFGKLNVTSRLQLMALALDGPLACSASCG